ncbi:phosphoribosylaminoimidazole-succinocarboxamide synthase [Jimgerdemannia flammicorona]|uniref:Phosphoribosylaminoimidazole-succinocarboxamide synthase n=1 Tax=Jimgerdemannia flammicorona TaxID=994334 RepID=A0A433BAA0_9FUNG|nr:phosphoribosylaminoimidazole-succinocarboxamide synthase [Jimgerdemannia flammicorona]
MCHYHPTLDNIKPLANVTALQVNIEFETITDPILLTLLIVHSVCPDLKLVARGKGHPLQGQDSDADVGILVQPPPRRALSRPILTRCPIGCANISRSLEADPCSPLRGYITGSGWAEYRRSGTICGIELPEELVECEKLPEPLFTPSTKAEIGGHDENIHPSKVTALIGEKHANAMATAAVQLYAKASECAAERGIIIADTKFEFGVDAQGNLVLIDARIDLRVQDSFDKQYLRNYLESIRFDKTSGVELPEDVVLKTLNK